MINKTNYLKEKTLTFQTAKLASTVVSVYDCQSRVELKPKPGHITFMEIEHEIISTAILPLSLVQEGLAKLCALSTG